jgi:NADPH-dependent glutamate synthase beta subunit-like oxidoreductase
MKPADRLKIVRQHMPEQNAVQRSRNFSEVNLGLATEVAKTEADRCLRCREGKCIGGCPVGVDIPHFVEAVAEGVSRRRKVPKKQRKTTKNSEKQRKKLKKGRKMIENHRRRRKNGHL